jgi:hypothetical protein
MHQHGNPKRHFGQTSPDNAALQFEADGVCRFGSLQLYEKWTPFSPEFRIRAA